jgi:hypothetical protein
MVSLASVVSNMDIGYWLCFCQTHTTDTRVTRGWYHADVSVQLYAPQTKILEGGTKDDIRNSNEALFNGS